MDLEFLAKSYLEEQSTKDPLKEQEELVLFEQALIKYAEERRAMELEDRRCCETVCEIKLDLPMKLPQSLKNNIQCGKEAFLNEVQKQKGKTLSFFKKAIATLKKL